MADKRVVKSKRNMENAFFELLENKDIESITIRDICERAEVSRSTFYDHYEDYPYFLKTLEGKAVDLMLSTMRYYNYDTNTDAMVDAIFSAVRDNHNLFAFIFDDRIKSRAGELLILKIKELTLPIWKKYTSLDVDEQDLLLDYMLAGSLRVLRKWWSSQTSIPEAHLKELFSDFIKYGVYHYIYI